MYVSLGQMGMNASMQLGLDGWYIDSRDNDPSWASLSTLILKSLGAFDIFPIMSLQQT